MNPGSTTRILHGDEPHELGQPSVDPIDLCSFYASAGNPGPNELGYARSGNRTWEALESALGRLEGAPAVSFASGLGATLALLLALARERKRLILPSDGYHGGRGLARKLEPFGIATELVDQADLEAVAQALKSEAAILLVETPTNPFLRVMDLEALAELAREHGAALICDNTTATAALQRPLDLGAMATVASLAKASSGHSDVILGAVATRDEALYDEVRSWRTYGGAIPGPFEAWAALRGLKTLPLRIQRQSSNALEIARWLTEHERVARVHYPGLEPRELVRRQMSDGGGPLLSFELSSAAAVETDAVVERSQRIVRGTSFGGVESSWERRSRWPGEVAPPNLIRLSVGIEEVRDLIADLEHALAN